MIRPQKEEDSLCLSKIYSLHGRALFEIVNMKWTNQIFLFK